jgi:hypothetical protein
MYLYVMETSEANAFPLSSFLLCCHMLTAKALQNYLLIISRWDIFVNTVKLVKIAGAIHVT